MSNMSYCRFENTARDLHDCFANMGETEGLSEHERIARQQIITLALKIAEEFGDELDDTVHDPAQSNPPSPLDATLARIAEGALAARSRRCALTSHHHQARSLK